MVFRNKNGMHFVGIGGVGMSGIAEILVTMGFKVSGSDMHESDNTRRLEALGVRVFIGHRKENILPDTCVIVTSSAISFDNEEMLEAKRRNIPLIHRSEMLAELIRLKTGIGVAGTHGKTTTSSMLSSVLWSCGLNPTSIVGGKVHNFGSNARMGGGEYLVFEADESDGSFLKLFPAISVVTNIDSDHLDHYKYFEGLRDAFLRYVNNIPFYGYSVLCIDDKVIREMLPQVERPYYTYGLSADADFSASDVVFEDGMTCYDCSINGKKAGRVKLQLLGMHNVVNSLSVIAVATELGVDFACIAGALAEFKGVGRRMDRVAEVNGILIMDDYGHHPTEIRATLAAVRTLGRRVVAVFQPHRYSRTQLLYDDFGRCFAEADQLFLTEIYPAGEKPIEGVSSRLIADEFIRHEDRAVEIIPNVAAVPDTVIKSLRPGDVLLTLGAGDIYKAGRALAEKLAAQ